MDPACLTRIRLSLPQLTRVERQVADYVLAYPARVTGMSVGELSAAIGAAPSGIIRFCKKAGYNGFTQLKISLAGHPEPTENVLLPTVGPEDDTRTVFRKVFQTSIKTLEDTLALMDLELIEQAVDMLHGAEKIELYGVGTSATIAMDSYYRLMRIGYPAFYATDSQVMRISAASLKPGQVAVGISHSGRAAETVDALKAARASGARTIAITSNQGSPICRYADLVLCISSDETRFSIEAISARIAHIAVLDAICVALSAKNYDRSIERVGIMNRLFDDLRRIP